MARCRRHVVTASMPDGRLDGKTSMAPRWRLDGASMAPRWLDAGAMHPTFVGWAGKIIAFESSRKKLKIKIYGDAGYEHLDIKSGKYAVSSLERLA